jgi:DNA-binding CsgD family transcriptional regulator
VWQRTGGNPYRLTELLAVAGDSGPAALAHAPLPNHLPSSHLPSSHLPSSHLPSSHLPSAKGPPVALGLAVAAERTPAAEAPAELTARESEVLSCLAAGMSNKQVARELGISVRTVTVHVSNLLRKTRTASRTEAALWAVHRGVSADDRASLPDRDQDRPLAPVDAVAP